MIAGVGQNFEFELMGGVANGAHNASDKINYHLYLVRNFLIRAWVFTAVAPAIHHVVKVGQTAIVMTRARALQIGR